MESDYLQHLETCVSPCYLNAFLLHRWGQDKCNIETIICASTPVCFSKTGHAWIRLHRVDEVLFHTGSLWQLIADLRTIVWAASSKKKQALKIGNSNRPTTVGARKGEPVTHQDTSNRPSLGWYSSNGKLLAQFSLKLFLPCRNVLQLGRGPHRGLLGPKRRFNYNVSYWELSQLEGSQINIEMQH